MDFSFGSLLECMWNATRGGRLLFLSRFRPIYTWLVLGVAWTTNVFGNPAGEQLVGGAVNFTRPDAATLLIHQQTDRAVINWNSFSIANGELTRFIQPSSTSAALNRVVTANPSQIYGTLQANGQVFLINPGGVMVGPGGVVDVAGFVASTHDIGTDEFMKAGSLHLQGHSEAGILNQGNVTAREGDVFLVAREVKNEGQLMAKDGTVGMVSGTEVSLQAVGMGNFKVRLLAAEVGSQGAGVGVQGAGCQSDAGKEGETSNGNPETNQSFQPKEEKIVLRRDQLVFVRTTPLDRTKRGRLLITRARLLV